MGTAINAFRLFPRGKVLSRQLKDVSPSRHPTRPSKGKPDCSHAHYSDTRHSGRFGGETDFDRDHAATAERGSARRPNQRSSWCVLGWNVSGDARGAECFCCVAELRHRQVRIYVPTRNTMQSGGARGERWRIDFDILQGGGRWENQLMGWASS